MNDEYSVLWNALERLLGLHDRRSPRPPPRASLLAEALRSQPEYVEALLSGAMLDEAMLYVQSAARTRYERRRWRIERKWPL